MPTDSFDSCAVRTAPRSAGPDLGAAGLCSLFALLVVLVLAATTPAWAAYTDCMRIGAPPSPPLVLDTPGVYCLVEDIDVALEASAAVRIDADDVTFDLNGHTIRNLRGLEGDPGISFGLVVYGERVEVRNGRIVAFDTGFLGSCNGESGHLVERLQIHRSFSAGARLDCASTVFRQNVVTASGGGEASWAYGVVIGGDLVQVVDNAVLRTTGRDGAVAISSGSKAMGGLVIENRISEASEGVRTFNAVGELRCRDNVTVHVANPYPRCTDLGNNH